MVLRTIERNSWNLGKSYIAFCNYGKSVLFVNSVNVESLEPIYQTLFCLAGIAFLLTSSNVLAAMESGLIISIQALSHYLRRLERKIKSMIVYEVSCPA